tara:strand:+ start:3238 stop:3756 length:519 start_codon:yes stop_codon:yes gene_type:complete
MRIFFIDQMAMYSAYHTDRRNQLTHYIGVPSIVFSLFILLSWVSLMQVGDITVTAAMIFLAVILIFYLLSDFLIGVIAALIYIPLLYLADYLFPLPSPEGWGTFAVLFIGGWVFQLWGHVYEGRKPALLDNLFQIFMAPAFLIAEVLFSLGGCQRLKAQIQGRMTKYTATGR